MADSTKIIEVEVLSVELDPDGGGDVVLRVETEDLPIFGAVIGHDVQLVVEFDEPQQKKKAKVLKIVGSTAVGDE